MRIWKILTLVIGSHFVFVQQSIGATCTAIASGNWNSASNWTCGHVPVAGDLVVIPLGLTVTITSNYNYSGSPMRIKIYGRLSFIGNGAKISLPCGSIVELMTSQAIITGNGSGGNSQTLRICNITYWKAANGTTSGPVTWPPNATLPVELLYFRGETVNGGTKLSWSTATESNCSHYEVQRSASDDDFITVGQINGAGNSTQTLTYDLIDTPPRKGLWYYRLVQYDFDGSFTRFGTIAVQTEHSQQIFCWPNPASDLVNISISDPPMAIEVLDPAGRMMKVLHIQELNSTLNVSEFKPGMYTLRITGKADSDLLRLVVM